MRACVWANVCIRLYSCDAFGRSVGGSMILCSLCVKIEYLVESEFVRSFKCIWTFPNMIKRARNVNMNSSLVYRKLRVNGINILAIKLTKFTKLTTDYLLWRRKKKTHISWNMMHVYVWSIKSNQFQWNRPYSVLVWSLHFIRDDDDDRCVAIHNIQVHTLPYQK